MTEPSSDPAPSAPDETARFASLLASGERVLLVRQRHWLTFMEAGRWFVLALVAGIVVTVLNSQISDDGVAGWLSTLLSWGFWIFFVIGLAGVVWYVLEWRVERYLVTTRRVIEAGGVVNKYTRDTSLQMITDMLVGHPWIGRMLGYGEIDLLTASEAGTSKIRFLPDADGFKTTLLDAKHEYELEVGGGKVIQDAVAAAGAAAGPVAGAPAATTTAPAFSADDVDASITRLADLRDRGLITEEEFQDKKREILDRL